MSDYKEQFVASSQLHNEEIDQNGGLCPVEASGSLCGICASVAILRIMHGAVSDIVTQKRSEV